jgi:hypothetical protein
MHKEKMNINVVSLSEKKKNSSISMGHSLKRILKE